ncbi:MAG: hypothetical protein JWQ01_1351, partial [Massilia sp.]|nr:hypothetical protein [Massilia sp.]
MTLRERLAGNDEARVPIAAIPEAA